MISSKYGGEDYALFGGGNASLKEGGVMRVKCSGVPLSGIKPEQFVAMDIKKLLAMLERDYAGGDAARERAALADMMAARIAGEEAKRPSVEAALHALFWQRYVLHTHPALVNGMTCGENGQKICGELFGDAAWVPLTKPGLVLAKKCASVFSEYNEKRGLYPQIVFLQNHGVFVAADDPREIDSIMGRIMGALKKHIKIKPETGETPFDRKLACGLAPALRMLYDQGGKCVVNFTSSKLAGGFVSSEESFAPLTCPFTPDHIVYCKDAPLYLKRGAKPREAFERYASEKGFPPKIVAVEGQGFFALGKNANEADAARGLFADAMKIAVYSKSFGGPKPLPKKMADFITNWEVESYRQKAQSGEAAPKRLAGKIAVITGGAQGIGRGIAFELAEEGAYIMVADINAAGAEKTAADLREKYGAKSAEALQVDVTDEESVKRLVEETTLAFGGVDVFIANAGILHAGGLREMTADKFEQVAKVNYAGYFLCVKHASEPMRLQREYSAGYTSDIIEINSKSGLTGSSKNFAYAGSKFGGIGLTQSFALELIEFGVKVNAVCPGNFFDGPLWSDPERGLFRQYLDAGKAPGAKTVADVREFYEAKVPMRRGCTAKDIALACIYAVEQQYETGQAIPVTGGQVMK